MLKSFSNKLLHWYEKYGRHDLPWQKNTASYRIWISEIMLQQTQVITVIPYFERFIKRFPNVKALAAANEDEVLSYWSGLGYYARARNIYKTACIVHEKFHGHFPQTVDALCELPGIGQSTAGAIISFSLQKKAVILDGNVKRVLSRYFATPEDLWPVAEKLTPNKNAHRYNQAMMDLGATLCTRTKPRCTDCPFEKTCRAHLLNQENIFPVRAKKKSRPTKQTRMLIIYNARDEILLLKRPSKGIWGGLWSLPECALQDDYRVFQKNKLNYIDEFEKITHQFTHFTLEIFPMLLKATSRAKPLDKNNCIWYTLNTNLPGGVAAPVAKIIKTLGQKHELKSNGSL